MPVIRILSDRVANQIAAGEVIERPAAVVKELVENSLDAGATRIEVEFRHGGRSLIRVEDNGSGMSKDDALLSLERHATSRLVETVDLDRLHHQRPWVEAMGAGRDRQDGRAADADADHDRDGGDAERQPAQQAAALGGGQVEPDGAGGVAGDLHLAAGQPVAPHQQEDQAAGEPRRGRQQRRSECRRTERQPRQQVQQTRHQRRGDEPAAETQGDRGPGTGERQQYHGSQGHRRHVHRDAGGEQPQPPAYQSVPQRGNGGRRRMPVGESAAEHRRHQEHREGDQTEQRRPPQRPSP